MGSSSVVQAAQAQKVVATSNKLQLRAFAPSARATSYNRYIVYRRYLLYCHRPPRCRLPPLASAQCEKHFCNHIWHVYIISLKICPSETWCRCHQHHVLLTLSSKFKANFMKKLNKNLNGWEILKKYWDWLYFWSDTTLLKSTKRWCRPDHVHVSEGQIFRALVIE